MAVRSCFHTKDFTLIDIARERNIGSDHFPMYIKLNYEPTAEAINEDTDAPAQEEENWAEEKIQNADPLMKKMDFNSLQSIFRA